MCLATTDPNGPKRCSGESRAACATYAAKVDTLSSQVSDLERQIAAPPRVSFADKTTRTEDIRREIDTAIANLSTPEQWQDWLAHAAKFHRYSLNNQLLIQIQRPTATQVAGFNKWKEMGRAPVKGAKAIWIQAPMIVKDKDDDGKPKLDKNGEPVTRVWFKTVPVFDVAQTDGDPVPEPPKVPYSRTEGVAPPEMHLALSEQIAKRGFTIDHRELPEDGPEGWTDFNAKQVVVSTRYSDAHTAMVLAHELAHIALGHGEDMRRWSAGRDADCPRSRNGDVTQSGCRRGAAPHYDFEERYGGTRRRCAVQGRLRDRGCSPVPLRRQGYSSRSLSAMLEWLRTTGHVARAEAFVELWNTASCAVLGQAGFEREGILRNWERIRGEPRDMYSYSYLFPPRS